MNAIAVVTGCVCGVLAGAGMVAALAPLQDGLGAAARHRLASSAFWLTAILPLLLAGLGGLAVTANGQSLWVAATAVFTDTLPAQPWLATLARCTLYAGLAVGAAGALRLARQIGRTGNLRKALHSERATRLPVATSNVPGPMLLGYRHPVVVLPEAAKTYPPAVARALVRHELAHATRCDNWRLLAENAAVALLPWCVPLRALHRMLLAAREELCDAVALRRADEPTRIAYGKALVEALRQSARRRALVSTMAGPMPAMRRRMAAILDPSFRPASLPWRQRGIAGLALSLSVVAAAAAWCIGGGLETAAGLHGMAMRFEPLHGMRGVYRITTLGGTAEHLAPGAYKVRFARAPSGEWVVTTSAAGLP